MTEANQPPGILVRSVTALVRLGVHDALGPTDAKYVQFVNIAAAVMLVGSLGGALDYLLAGEPLALAVHMVSPFAHLGSLIANARHRFFMAKILLVAGVFLGTVGTAFVVGWDYPAHLWIIPTGLLVILAFRADERRAMFALLATGLGVFVLLEFGWQQLEPLVDLWADSPHKPTIVHLAQLWLVVVVFCLAAAMHGRFGVQSHPHPPLRRSPIPLFATASLPRPPVARAGRHRGWGVGRDTKGVRALGDYYAQWGQIVLGSVGQLQGVNNAMLNRLHRQLQESRTQIDQLVGAILENRIAEVKLADERRAEERAGDARTVLAQQALQQLGDAAKAFLTAKGVHPEMAEVLGALGQSPELVQTLADPDVKALMNEPANLAALAQMLKQAAAQARAARQLSEQPAAS